MPIVVQRVGLDGGRPDKRKSKTRKARKVIGKKDEAFAP